MTEESRKILPVEEAERVLGLISAQQEVQKLVAALGSDACPHLVGGSVRDALCGSAIYDLDFATSLRPEEAAKRLQKASFKVIETGVDRGTVMVPGPPEIEITTFRRASGRNATLYSESIEEDLAGRDFTINALVFSLKESRIIDLHGGIADLQASILRCVGAPRDRFMEDPLRILRMLRFGPSQGRQIHPDTARAAHESCAELRHVSVERIHDEFERIITSPFPAAAVRVSHELGIFGVLFPELLPMVEFEQNRFHCEDVFNHTLTVLSRCPENRLVRLAAFFHDAGKPHTLSVDEDGDRHFYSHERISEEIASRIMERLRFSRDDISAVCMLVRQHMRSVDCGPAGARRIMRDTGSRYEEWRELKIADAPPCETDEVFHERLRRFDELVLSERARLRGSGVDDLVINGDDLIGIGFREGVLLGHCLDFLKELILEDPSRNTREDLLSSARAFLASAG